MNTIRWKMPDQYLTEWYRNLSGAVKTAFYAAFAAGLAAHLYQFTNKLYNYDELANTPGGIGLSTEQGRWLLNWMGRFMRSVFGGSYSLPFFNGIFALLFLALSAGMVVSVFQVRNKLTAGLIGGLMTVFPAVVSMYFFMFLAGTSMPFGAMASVVSTDPIDRSKLSRARSLGGTFVGIAALSFVPVVCFDSESNIIPERFTLLAVIFGILSVVCYCLLLHLTTERVREEKKQNTEKFNYGNVLKAVVKNRPLIGVMVATIGSMLYITGSNQIRSYVFKEYYGNTSAMTLLSLASVPIIIICFPLVPKLVAKFGKKTTLMFGVISSTVLSVIIFAVKIPNVYVYSVLNVLAMIGQTVFTMLIWALVTDCLDYSEWKFHERSDGSMYSLYTFSRKIGSTIASAGVSFGLQAIGYISGNNVVQSDATINNIYMLVALIPVLTCVLELIGIGAIFNLDKEQTKEMYAELKQRRE